MAPTPALRRTALFAEHVALGAEMPSDIEPSGAYHWAGMAMPWTYSTSLAEEQRAVRERAGVCDTSQLQVVRVSGPGAGVCLERMVPRRIMDMRSGTSRFTVVLSRFGRILDEALILRMGVEEFWISHGCGGTQRQLASVLGQTDCLVEVLAGMHVLAVQGPMSLLVLAPLLDAPLAGLPVMEHRRVRLAGRPVTVSRTGFTGEIGFEIFCEAGDALALWHEILVAGRAYGVLPYSYSCVDLLRIEAGFSLYPAELGLAASVWDVGLGWLVKGKEADFVGRAAVERARGEQKHRLVGIRCPGSGPVARGAVVRLAGAAGVSPGEGTVTGVGVVTSSAWSPARRETLCIARVSREGWGVAPPLAGEARVIVAGAAPRAGWLVGLPFVERRGGFG